MTRIENALLIVCGSILLFIQYILVRELGSTLYSTELVVVFSTTLILIGPSVAYAVVDKLNKAAFCAWGVATFAIALSMPFSIRLLVAYSYPLLEIPALILLFITGSLFVTGFFAAILPKITPSGTFARAYVCELAGALLALLTILTSPNWHFTLALFWCLLIICLHLSLKNLNITILALVFALGIALGYPLIDRFATREYYERFWQYNNPEVLETCYSPYQRIDIICDTTGKILCLDGLSYFDSNQLNWFNFYMAEVPAKLSPRPAKSNALVLGSGSFTSTKMLQQQGFEVTTVELDPDVARLGLKYFEDTRQFKVNLIIDDARHYITTQPDASLDVIVLDVPAPHRLQTAFLYTPAFFRELKRCLKPEGVVSVSNCGTQYNDVVTLPITAGVAEVFEDMVAVYGKSADTTTLYASRRLPFDEVQLKEFLTKNEKSGFQIFDNKRIRNLVKHVKPNCEDNLRALILFSQAALPGQRE